jgi:carboxypeptidase C (cathepsin A)
MKILLASLILSVLITLAPADSLNPVNPNFNYPESTVVNSAGADIPYQGQLHTGYLTVNLTSQSKLFYIVYPAGGAQNASATLNNSAPLILWLQGGPGCADGPGNYAELGPFTVIDNNGTLVPTLVPITWNDKYNILFVDSPVGVGYSVSGGERPNNAMDTVRYLQVFLIRFFQIYPSLAPNDFYIFGESFGGHYVPALATVLVQNITQNGINLKGIGIGNGWNDPYVQLASFTEYPFATSLLDQKSRDNLYALEIEAREAVTAGDYYTAAKHFDDITGYLTDINANISYYNFEVYNAPNPPYPDWLNLAATKTAYGVDPSVTYQDCVNQTYFDFYPDIGLSYIGNYSFLLSQTILPNLRVILYSGQNDIICNTAGTLNYLSTVQWPGNENFISSQKTIFKKSDGSVAGNYKNYDKLTFAVIYDAGHMAPGDQPESARIVLEMFIQDQFTHKKSALYE